MAATTIEMFLRDAARAHCEGFVRCAEREIDIAQTITSVDHCIDFFVGTRRNQASDLVALIGTSVRFDASASTAACFGAIGQQGCERGDVGQYAEPFLWPSECRTILAGTVETDGACGADEACIAGTCECGQCAGAVAPRGGVGDSCERPFDEEPAGTCEYNLLCVDGTCHAPGEYRTVRQGGRCAAVEDLDMPRDLCARGLVCVHDRGDEPGTCRPWHARGEACGRGGAHPICEPGTVCNGGSVESTCRPPAREGETCDPTGAGDPCAVGLICALGESRCRPVQNNGGACTDDSLCYGAFCDANVCTSSSGRFCETPK